MSDRPLTMMDVESWKKFVHGEDEPPQGFKADEVILVKDCNAHVVKGSHADLAKREVTIVFSTESIDRDGDIIRQRGLDFKAFKENPVVLFAHNGRALPIGRSMKIFQTDSRTRSASVDRFTPPDLNELGDTVFRMLTHDTPFLNAASIGFRPTKFEHREVDEEERQGFFFPTDFIKSEKLEHSIVPVPANSEALVAAKSVGIDLSPIKAWAEEMLDADMALKDGVLSRENIERCWGIACGTRSFVVPDIEGVHEEQERVSDKLKVRVEVVGPHEVKEECSCKDEVIVEFKGTIPPNPSGFPTAPADTAWSRPRFRDFESEGTFEELPASRRRAIARHFGWAEAMPPETFGQLKLPHHQASNMAVVLRGVNAALAVLNGARGGVDIPDGDRAPTNRHLNAHRRNQFDLEPIELRSMEDEEMKTLLKRLAAEIADHEGTTEEVAAKALDEAIEEFAAANKADDGDDAAIEPGDLTKEQLEGIVSSAVEKLYEDEVDAGVDGNASKVEDSTEGAKDPEVITYQFGDTEMEITSEDFAAAVKAAVEGLLQSKQKEEEAFEFPSVKDEADATKDEVGVQLSELRAGQRAMAELVKKLVDAITASGEPGDDVPNKGTDVPNKGTSPEKGSDDEVVMVVADDEPETKNDDEGPSGTDIGTLIATQTAEAVTRAFAKATGRLPN